MDGAVTLMHLVRSKSGFLELTVYVAGKNAGTQVRAVRPFSQYAKAFMWFRSAVEGKAVTKEAPCQGWITR
jgi:hypothetical protein